MNLKNKENYLDTTKIREGTVKIDLLKDAAKSQFRCTYLDGRSCQEQAIYTVHANYKKNQCHWVCQEHLIWAIDEVKPLAYKLGRPKQKKEDFILEHDIHIKYLWDNYGYQCSFKNLGWNCYDNPPKWEISLKDSKDKRNFNIACARHFQPAIKFIIVNNKGKK